MMDVDPQNTFEDEPADMVDARYIRATCPERTPEDSSCCGKKLSDFFARCGRYAGATKFEERFNIFQAWLNVELFCQYYVIFIAEIAK